MSKENKFTLAVSPDSPCGCGSGRKLEACCLKNGKIQISPKSIFPSRYRTNQAVKKCIFSSRLDCEGKISGDHIFSASVLNKISSKRILFHGEDFSREVSINGDSLKVNRLCRKHNSALSPLDVEAGRFFQVLQKIESDFEKGSSLDQKLFLFSGFDLERWLLKTLFAAYYSRISNAQRENQSLPVYLLHLFEFSPSPPYGLYIPFMKSDREKSSFTHVPEASLALIFYDNLVSGISVTLCGFEIKLMVAGTSSQIGFLSKTHYYRPSYIHFYEGKTVFSIVLGWPQKGGESIWISRGSKDSSPPFDI